MPGARTSLDLTPAIASQTAAQKAIDQASGRLDVTQTAMKQIQSVASTFYAKLDTLNGLDASTVDTVAASARSALTNLAGLLNATDGSTYIFAGQDSANAPVPSGDAILSSGFFTQIQSSVAALSANGAAATAAATLATASSNAIGTSPFSAALSTATPAQASVPTGGGSSVTAGLVASANSTAVSSGSSTTGSYMRDLMRALATIGSLSSSQLGDAANFSALVSDTRTSLRGAITSMSDDVGTLGNTQSALTDTGTRIGDTQTALKTQLSNAQEVDMADTLSQLTATQTQMQASYKLIAGMGDLSLVKFIS